MSEKCFFCDIQKKEDKNRIGSSSKFFSRYCDFPVSNGHALVFPKKHIPSVFEIPPKQLNELFDLVKKTKEEIENEYGADGFNIGINEGKAAGQSIPHFHIHIIPRYKGDVDNPKGGIRNIFPDKADYTLEAKKDDNLKDYV